MDYLRSKCWTVGVIILLFGLMLSCNSERSAFHKRQLFSLLDSKHTHIDFFNQVEYTEEYNTYTYRNFYNGAGVGLGDFNNDNLTDIYFCGNLVGNKLYLNKGNFVFEDITEKAGVGCEGSWSTGVSIADVNGDGWEDIYVCKSGKPDSPNRSNELFINNHDLTFTERAAEYGLAVRGLSNHASFFDYDHDGDLDCYLLNNSFQSITDFDMKPGQREIRDTLGGNKLYRNDNGHFVDVSEEAGIYGSKIGFGLGVSVSDMNRDGWPDIYISNDFFERDYLYINNKNGTFTECLEDQIHEISTGAMGADVADINNDAWPEIFTTEMTPEDNMRLKTKALFEDWEIYQMKVKNGYFNQFARNVLQLNNRNGTFSEIGRFSGVAATDWSWGALIMDLDNDGWKDIFVANGIYKDLLDRDYLDIYSNPSMMRTMIKTEEKATLSLINMIPSVRLPNYAFHNNGDLTFTNLSSQWGLDLPSFSNGAAYGDLDNDGDLDLVINNVNMPSFVYRNETDKLTESNYLSLRLKGTGQNTDAIGAEVTLYYDGTINYQELIPVRGFQSTSENRLHFGLGSSKMLDSLVVSWPDGQCSVLYNVEASQYLTIQKNSPESCQPQIVPGQPHLFIKIENIPGLDYIHRENDFDDFQRDRLLFRMISDEGPHIAVADVNNDGKEDLFICGAKNSPGTLFVQDRQGHFTRTNEALFEKDRISEDTDCAFFDADGDGDQDLYVASGGNEFPATSSALSDRLYLNDGSGHFHKSDQILPAGKFESTSCVRPSDFDNDGDADLFTGIRLHPFAYGVPANGYLLENDGHGNFADVTGKKAPGLINIGMITDMRWADVDNDGDQDMVIAGDWMPLEIFINNNGSFTNESDRFGLKNTSGWWHIIIPADLNGDGNIDFIAGNHGLNSFFKATEEKPVIMYVNDFDLNGTIEQIICTWKEDKYYPVAMKDELVKQIPSLAGKYKKFDDYKSQTVSDIFSADVLNRSLELNSHLMESCALINSGHGSFRIIPLPVEAQFFPVFAADAGDFDHNGKIDIIIGGNQNRAKPETGIYDAGYGLLITGDNVESLQSVPALQSGLSTSGEIRDLKKIMINGKQVLIVARNNGSLQFYKF
jgi:hypothetical protein